METPVRLMGCVVVAIMTVLGMRVLARHSIQRLICHSLPPLRASTARPCGHSFSAGRPPDWLKMKNLNAPARRLKEAVLFLHFELIDEYSEMPGHGGRKGVVLVLQALPNC